MIALILLTIGVIGLVLQIIPFDNKYVVKKGKHRFKPIMIGVTFKKRWVANVSFDPSCKYDIGSEDQKDINKLFGVGYVTWQSLIWCIKNKKALHHYNSWRLGWYYDGTKFILMYYMYINGEKKSGVITKTPYLEIKTIPIEQTKYEIIFSHFGVQAEFKGLPLKLGGYFGGNIAAPHKMEYYLKIK